MVLWAAWAVLLLHKYQLGPIFLHLCRPSFLCVCVLFFFLMFAHMYLTLLAVGCFYVSMNISKLCCGMQLKDLEMV